MKVKINNHSLTDFDKLLKQCIENSKSRIRSNGVDSSHILHELQSHLQVELDNTKTELSEAFYNIDLAMRHGADTLPDRNIYESLRAQAQRTPPKPENDLHKKYVKETSYGYAVYDLQTTLWFDFSKESTITVDLETDYEGTPVMKVNAYDPKNGKTIRYQDDYVLTPHVFQPQQYGYGFYPNRRMEHTDSHYDAASGFVETGNGWAGNTAGTLEAAFIGKSQFKEPVNFLGKNWADGSWQSKNGDFYRFNDIEKEINGFKKQQLKVSKHWSEQRNSKLLKSAKYAKSIGRVCFVISVGAGIYNMASAKIKDDSNQDAVFLRNRIDIGMSVIALVPFYGWAISASYFLIMSKSELGDLGQASGFSKAEAEAMHQHRIENGKTKLDDVVFDYEMELMIPETKKTYREQTTVARDNTYVVPKRLFTSDFK